MLDVLLYVYTVSYRIKLNPVDAKLKSKKVCSAVLKIKITNIFLPITSSSAYQLLYNFMYREKIWFSLIFLKGT